MKEAAVNRAGRNMGMNYRVGQNLFLHSVLVVLAIIISIPVVWLVLSSLKAESDLVSEGLLLFSPEIQWDNYVRAFTDIPFMRYTRNSFVLAGMSALLTMLTSATTGYAFARIDGFGREKLFAIVIVMILIPVGVYIIPQFILFSNLKITNSYWPWFLLALGGSPFYIFLFRQYFRSFPKELEEAAELDGANIYRIFLQIILPNAKAIMATVFILQFLFIWSDFLMPLLYLSNENTVLAAVLTGSAYTNPQGYPVQTLRMAGSVLYMVPPLMIFFFAQKYIMQGVVTSGLKG